jgi:perosamine synthetase
MTDREPIPFHRPNVGVAELDAMVEVVESGWLTTGRRAKEFEEAFGVYVGTRHAVAVNSATAALHLALEGLGVTDDDEVIVPTYTFAASAEVALYLRARPVLVDVDPVTTSIDAAAAAAAITDRTKVVEAVHVGGLPADLRAVMDATPGIPLIEDVAHAFPSPMAEFDGRFAGTIGRAGAYSFYATKTITTGEGGMLVTDDDALADRARSMRLHGIGRDAWKRYEAGGSWHYEIRDAGFKDNLTDVAAAIGLVQLSRAAELRDARAAIARRYHDRFASAVDEGRLVLPPGIDDPAHAWHLYAIRLGPAARPGDEVDPDLPGVVDLPPALQLAASRRARTIDALAADGIGTSVHFIPLHLHPLYRRMGYRVGQFPAAESAYASAISLPIWPGMSDDQIGRVVEAVDSATR